MCFFKFLLMMFTGFFITANAMASDVPASADDEAMQTLLRLLEVETDIATKTKMNADYVPGMVSILHGNELEALGIDNVWQALQLVPGVHIDMSQQGDRQIVVRGLGGEFISPEVKMLINDKPVHNALLGYGPSLYMPVSMVERIEVVRGPGSSLYGDYAFAGVINIVTRKHDSGLMLQYGSFNTRQGTAMVAGESNDGKLHYSMLATTYQTNGANSAIAADAIGQRGNADESIDTNVVAITVAYKKTEINAKFDNITGGNHYGLLTIMEPVGQRGNFDSNDTMLGVKQGVTLANDVELKVYGDYMTYRNQAKYTITPPANKMELYYKERTYQAGTELDIARFNGHRLLFGAEYRDSKPLDIWLTSNFIFIPPLTIPIPTTRITGAGNWIKEGHGRKSAGLYFQDQYALTDAMTITAGLRHDRFSDVGNSTSPRIGMVYNIGDRHLLKAQYSQAFRPPTLYELFENGGSGNPALRPETLRNYEVGYIFTTPEQVFRATMFHTRINNLITRVVVPGLTAPQFTNMHSPSSLSGGELEFEQRFDDYIHSTFNLTYVKTRDTVNARPLAGSASLLANLIVTWQAQQNFSMSVWGHYVGSRNRAYNDTRSKLPADTTVDLAITANNLPAKGLVFHAGVKNLFDHKVMYPAPPVISGDFSGPPRSFWSSLSYRY
ncbi:MAG: hypothetical protein AUJ57_00465 [Zetaproteobacteria bacterium CG1_02_53_45]|nr:MAG: hypothetical protein AUJ57_00465 [Zetaproteobacteria bacterium CG1_02_53_45]